MSKSRLEAFSDGIFAIIITIMVLSLEVPTTGSWSAILSAHFLGTIWAYLLSFLFVASFWISHHLIIGAVATINKRILWTNILMLLPMSLLPLVTGWVIRFNTATAPNVCYIAIYTLSVLGIYALGRVTLPHTKPQEQALIRQGNHIRGYVLLFSLVATGITCFIPIFATIAVVGILVGWQFISFHLHA